MRRYSRGRVGSRTTERPRSAIEPAGAICWSIALGVGPVSARRGLRPLRPRRDAWFDALSPSSRQSSRCSAILFASMVAAVVGRVACGGARRGRAALRRGDRTAVPGADRAGAGGHLHVGPSTPARRVATLYVSPQIERILGYTPEEWLEDPTFWNEHHPPRRSRRASWRRRPRLRSRRHAVPRGVPVHRARRPHRLDPRRVGPRSRSTPNGRPLRMQGVMFDITAQKEAETRLQEAENRFRTIVERVPAVAYTWDAADGRGRLRPPTSARRSSACSATAPSSGLEDPSAVGSADSTRTIAIACWHVVGPSGRRARSRSPRSTGSRRSTAPGCGCATRPCPWRRARAAAPSTRASCSTSRSRSGPRTASGSAEELPVVTYLANEQDPERQPRVAPLHQPAGRGADRHAPGEWMAGPTLGPRLIHPDDRAWVLRVRKTERTG